MIRRKQHWEGGEIKLITIEKEEEIDETSSITGDVEANPVLHEATQSVRILFT